jgi:hypothetical protein
MFVNGDGSPATVTRWAHGDVETVYGKDVYNELE